MLRIASVLFSDYPADARPRREAEALVEAGMLVDVICLQGDGQQREEETDGVHVYRLRVKHTRGGRLRYLWEYGWFILLAFFKLSVLHAVKGYDVVHVHNMPDALVFSALLPRLSGAKIILDLHDPMPELCMTKYSISASHPAIRLLYFLEKQSIRFAHTVLTPNQSFRDIFILRGCPERKICIVMNSPCEKIFRNDMATADKVIERKDGQFVIMYHGLVAERSGLDTALRAMILLRGKIPNLAFHVFGAGDFLEEFLRLVDKLNLAEMVAYHGVVSLEIIAQAIRSIDVGIIPNRMTPFTNLNLPTRIFEYLFVAKPVIAPRTKGILDYFDESSLFFFDPGDPQSLADRILEVFKNSAQCRGVVKQGLKIYQAYRWELQREHFIKVVRSLIGKNGDRYIDDQK